MVCLRCSFCTVVISPQRLKVVAMPAVTATSSRNAATAGRFGSGSRPPKMAVTWMAAEAVTPATRQRPGSSSQVCR
jgi:hypothetical protein